VTRSLRHIPGSFRGDHISLFGYLLFNYIRVVVIFNVLYTQPYGYGRTFPLPRPQGHHQLQHLPPLPFVPQLHQYFFGKLTDRGLSSPLQVQGAVSSSLSVLVLFTPPPFIDCLDLSQHFHASRLFLCCDGSREQPYWHENSSWRRPVTLAQIRTVSEGPAALLHSLRLIRSV